MVQCFSRSISINTWTVLRQSPTRFNLHQPQLWTSCAVDFLTAASLLTCPMATWLICKGLILLHLLHPVPPLSRLHPLLLVLLQPPLLLLLLRLSLQPLSAGLRLLHPAQASSALLPMWWSRRQPQRDWLSKALLSLPRSSRCSWWLMSHKMNGQYSLCLV